MDKQSLIRDIRPVLEGVPCVTTGRTKRYLIGDIAERILEMRRY